MFLNTSFEYKSFEYKNRSRFSKFYIDKYFLNWSIDSSIIVSICLARYSVKVAHSIHFGRRVEATLSKPRSIQTFFREIFRKNSFSSSNGGLRLSFFLVLFCEKAVVELCSNSESIFVRLDLILARILIGFSLVLQILLSVGISS